MLWLSGCYSGGIANHLRQIAQTKVAVIMSYEENLGNGGVGGIRTLEGVATQHAFQACALNRSATTPEI